jgi:hypothetical protein
MPSRRRAKPAFDRDFWGSGRRTAYPEVTAKKAVLSGLATTQELNEDLYLRRSYLTLLLNGTGYQESKLES